MSEEYEGMQRLLKSDNFCNVMIDTKLGYVIRMCEYPGATFTVTDKGSILVGQSSRMNYDYESWQRLQQELAEGMKYMSRVIMAGRYPDMGKPTYIKPKEYVDGALYLDYKNELILWLGEGYLFSEGRFVEFNRSGCKYLYGSIFGGQIKNMVVKGGVCHVSFDPDGQVWVDSRSTKPAKLIKCLWTPPAPYTALCVRGNYVAQWRKHP